MRLTVKGRLDYGGPFPYNEGSMALEKFKHFFKYIVIDILLAALISFLLINYVVSAYRISGASMNTLLRDGDRVFISKLGIREKSLHRFDIIVHYKPDRPDQSVLKRIIGLPGEVIEIRKGNVYINDQALAQPFLPQAAAASSRSDLSPLLIPHGHYFVLGDNRADSLDSRLFGPVPLRYIQGKVFFRYWPFNRFGKIE